LYTVSRARYSNDSNLDILDIACRAIPPIGELAVLEARAESLNV
jgi:hypothetical protein